MAADLPAVAEEGEGGDAAGNAVGDGGGGGDGKGEREGGWRSSAPESLRGRRQDAAKPAWDGRAAGAALPPRPRPGRERAGVSGRDPGRERAGVSGRDPGREPLKPAAVGARWSARPAAALRDVAFRLIESKAFKGFLILAFLWLSFSRITVWAAFGPGVRWHAPFAAHGAYFFLLGLALFAEVTYNLKYRRVFRAPIQRHLLRRIFVITVTLCLAALLLLLWSILQVAARTERGLALFRRLETTHGPDMVWNGADVFYEDDFVIELSPFQGMLAPPFLLLVIIFYHQTALIRSIGRDALG